MQLEMLGFKLLCNTLFGIFINDLIKDVKDLKLSVRIRNELISILAFADDIAILANAEEELKCIENWCKNEELKLTLAKQM